MNIKEFARKNRLKGLRRDECGDANIFGRRGDIYEYGDRLFAATILRAPNARYWDRYRKTAKTMGLRVTQNGDEEGTFLFDPTDETQAKFAIRAIRASHKRTLSPENLEKFIAASPLKLRKTQTGIEDDLPAVPEVER